MAAASRQRRPRSWKVKTLFAAVVLLGMLIVAEVAGRLLVAEPDRPELAGLPLPPKPAGTFRIVAIGESTTAGSPVRELGYVPMLEYWLGKAQVDRPVEVVNLAALGKDSLYARRRVENVLRDKPDLLIVFSVQNEFIKWHSNLGANRWLDEAMRHSGLIRVMVKVREKFFGPIRVAGENRYNHVPALTDDPAAERRIVASFKENTEAIANLAKSAGIPLILCTGPSNVVEWRPVLRNVEGRGYDEGLRTAASRIEAAMEKGQLDDARREVSAAIEARGDEATLLWLRGRIALSAGNPDAARPDLLRAKEVDPYPWRAKDVLNDIIRQIAARDSLPLLDVDMIFRERAAHGLVAKDLIADNCHPTPAGCHLMVERLLDLLAGRGILLDAKSLGALGEVRLETYRQALSLRNPDADFDSAFLIKTARWCLIAPFRNVRLANEYLAAARTRVPEDAGFMATQATADLLTNDDARAEELLRKAVEPGRTNVAGVNVKSWFGVANTIKAERR